ncbi:MAG: flagellar type III secretion system pore protein FliP [Firmicutes bacterium]|nr:flagellar type III secretion system pore protein FliP [Bacillota bacterium]
MHSNRRPLWAGVLSALGLLLALTGPVWAASPTVKVALPTATPSTLSLLFALMAVTFLPAVILTVTAFPRIIIVLSILRTALGLQNTPPNLVLIGLSLFFTAFIMEPTLAQINQVALTPYLAGHLALPIALTRAETPFRTFLLQQTRPTDLAFLFHVQHLRVPRLPQQTPLFTLIPAFMLSQVSLAFEMGVLIYLPFVVIDLAVSTIMMSMGMIMVPPTLVSLPIKLLLFVLADGWTLVFQSLIQSFH